MTNQEVAKSLKNIRNIYPWGEDSYKTLDYAIRAVVELPKRRKEAKRWRAKALEQEPCENAISRQAVKEQMIKYGFHAPDMTVTEFVEDLLPVNPQEPKYCDRNICIKNECNGIGCDECEVTKSQEPKTGHWKRISIDKYSEHAMYWYRCDRCGKDNLGNTDWRPNCGAKMVEPRESEEQE